LRATSTAPRKFVGGRSCQDFTPQPPNPPLPPGEMSLAHIPESSFHADLTPPAPLSPDRPVQRRARRAGSSCRPGSRDGVLTARSLGFFISRRVLTPSLQPGRAEDATGRESALARLGWGGTIPRISWVVGNAHLPLPG